MAPALTEFALGGVGAAVSRDTGNGLAQNMEVSAARVIAAGDGVEELPFARVGEGEGDIPMGMCWEEGVEVGGERILVAEDGPLLGRFGGKGLHDVGRGVNVALRRHPRHVADEDGGSGDRVGLGGRFGGIKVGAGGWGRNDHGCSRSWCGSGGGGGGDRGSGAGSLMGAWSALLTGSWGLRKGVPVRHGGGDGKGERFLRTSSKSRLNGSSVGDGGGGGHVEVFNSLAEPGRERSEEGAGSVNGTQASGAFNRERHVNWGEGDGEGVEPGSTLAKLEQANSSIQ